MDSLDKSILNAIQFDFPLVVKPFAAIADKLGITERNVLDKIAELKKIKTVRQISAIFDSSKIGYAGVLVAFKVPKRSLNAVALLINAHPGVSHNYVRSDAFNLWFTLTVPSDIDLKKEASHLAKRAGVREWLFLPTIRKFKISFQLDMNGTSYATTKKHESASSTRTLAISRPFVRELQKDLPLLSRPFAPSAKALGWTEGKIARELKRYIRSGAIRRFASVLRPVNAGFPANVLTVWAPRVEQVSVLGSVAASNKNVSHCYERPAFPNWPYSVYTMIHGRSVAQCDRVIRAISKESGVTAFRKLTSIREYKKIRVEYFPENEKTPKINANSKSGKGDYFLPFGRVDTL
jgi:DNA-binding Lrp family transcriptional regulator